MLHLIGNRPYGNFGQPNNMATFLIMGLLGCLFLYEKNKATVWLLFLQHSLSCLQSL